MSQEKTVLFAFRGDPLCFVHVLLNGIDMHERGRQGLIVIEGEKEQKKLVSMLHSVVLWCSLSFWPREKQPAQFHVWRHWGKPKISVI